MVQRTIPLIPKVSQGTKLVLAAGMLFGSLLLLPAVAQSTAPAPATASVSAAPPPAQVATHAVAGTPTRFQPNSFGGRAAKYYALFRGIRSPSVKAPEAGESIRSTCEVLDTQTAKTISDKYNGAYLIFPDAKTRLSVPSLEEVGKLRQSSTPEAGKTYSMAFSNPGRRVRREDRVNVVTGLFHADGLVVG